MSSSMLFRDSLAKYRAGTNDLADSGRHSTWLHCTHSSDVFLPVTYYMVSKTDLLFLPPLFGHAALADLE